MASMSKQRGPSKTGRQAAYGEGIGACVGVDMVKYR